MTPEMDEKLKKIARLWAEYCTACTEVTKQKMPDDPDAYINDMHAIGCSVGIAVSCLPDKSQRLYLAWTMIQELALQEAQIEANAAIAWDPHQSLHATAGYLAFMWATTTADLPPKCQEEAMDQLKKFQHDVLQSQKMVVMGAHSGKIH